jgi:radical SAM superfamily enzyme YgiQ (UPF0313 family)
MDLLLINPPREIPQKPDFPPIGLAYIASYLRQNGFDARVLDASSFSWRKLKEALKKRTARIVGVPCWTVERGQSFKTARLLKEILPQSRLIMGGHHATAFPEHMFKLAGADAVVIGEGEITTLELTRVLLDEGDLGGVKGIAYERNGEVFLTEPRDLIKDLDSLPTPSPEEFNLDDYLGLAESKGRAAAIITSRGCPHRCIFCSGSKFWRRRWRARSADSVLDEIERLYKDFGVGYLLFFDDNFTVNKERAIEICKGIIERNLHIQWAAESHVSHVSKDLLTWMEKSGCYRIDFGVESGSPRILSNIKKGQDVEQIEEAFRLTHEAGIKPRAYLMVGNPGEDETTIRETAKLMKKIKAYDTLGAQILWVLPDTENYEMVKSKGIITDDYWLTNNAMMYYTAEHTVEELKNLRDLLMKELAKNRDDFGAYAAYLLKKTYYRFPALQRLRTWKRQLGEKPL